MMKGYRKDLAYIHDRGFSSFSLQAASGFPGLFKRFGLPEKTVVDLGCGSGRLAAELRRRGYTVTGIDSSPSMIALARKNLPGGEFRLGSLWNCAFPRCGTIVSVGEVLNYQFDGKVSARRLHLLFSRMIHALVPSGLVIFDILCERASEDIRVTRTFTEGKGWCVTVEKTDAPKYIIRRITSFRRLKGAYRKSTEDHRVLRLNRGMVLSCLRDAGFKTYTLKGYTNKHLGNAHPVIVGKKPG